MMHLRWHNSYNLAIMPPWHNLHCGVFSIIIFFPWHMTHEYDLFHLTSISSLNVYFFFFSWNINTQALFLQSISCDQTISRYHDRIARKCPSVLPSNATNATRSRDKSREPTVRPSSPRRIPSFRHPLVSVEFAFQEREIGRYKDRANAHGAARRAV